MAAKAKKSGVVRRAKAPEIELVDDAWPRFEALVKSAAKMGHKPHEQKPAARGKKKSAVNR